MIGPALMDVGIEDINFDAVLWPILVVSMPAAIHMVARL